MNQPITPTPPKKSFPLWPLIILVFLLLGITAFLAYQNLRLHQQISQLTIQPSPSPITSFPETPSADPTADWKTYQDESVAFQYPGVWTLNETEVYGSHSINNFIYENNIIFEFAKYANYSQETGTAYQSLDKYLKNDIGKRKDITINNNPAKLMVYSGTGLSTPSKTALFFSPDRKSIMMLHQPNLDQSKNSDNTFDQILSTFKFSD